MLLIISLDHGRQLTKTINYYTQKINVAKSASGVLKSIGLNSPSNMATTASLNSKETRSSAATSNTSNVSVGEVSSTNNSILVSPNKAMFVQEDEHNTDEHANNQVSPSVSIGEEALKTAHEKVDDVIASKKDPSTKKESLVQCKANIDKTQQQQQAASQQTFCDPLLRRESESESTLSMSKIKDMNISKVVEKCQSSM